MASSDSQASDRWQHPPRSWLAELTGAVTFYTQIPVPVHWPVRYTGIARYAPLIGLGIGGGLWAIDTLLFGLQIPIATRSGLLVGLWLLITGGLHLDGAMDTADGLAVLDPSQRLEVMADSRTGAFGVMAAIAVLGLKAVALAELDSLRGVGLMLVAGWGRWGQVVAIARYPYLKPEGKGAFHKAHARPATDWLLGILALIACGGLFVVYQPDHWPVVLGTQVGGVAIAITTGAWFNRQLGGHTGDTYGAIVEWTEALLLCLMTGLCSVFGA